MNNCGASEEEVKAVGKPPWGRAAIPHSHEPLPLLYISQALPSFASQASLILSSLLIPKSLFLRLPTTRPSLYYFVRKLTACSVHFKFDHHFPNENRIPFIQGLKRFPWEYGVGVRPIILPPLHMCGITLDQQKSHPPLLGEALRA